MKYLASLVLVLMLLISTIGQTWTYVGNAAGASELALLLAQSKALELKDLDPAFSPFAERLKSVKLEFKPEGQAIDYQVAGNVWTLFSNRLLKYDFNGDQVLDLKEAYVLFLAIYQSETGEDSSRLRDMILNNFTQAEEHLILENIRLRWFAVSNRYGFATLQIKNDAGQVLTILREELIAKIPRLQNSEFAVYYPVIETVLPRGDSQEIYLSFRVRSLDGAKTLGRGFLQITIQPDGMTLVDLGLL